MSARPLLVCSGFFGDRHATLLGVLGERFDIRYMGGSEALPPSARFPLRSHLVPQEEQLAALREFVAVLDGAAEAAPPAPDPEGRARALRHLLQQWGHGRDIRLSLAELHRETPVRGVLVVNDHLAPNRALVDEARRLGIPTFYVEHGYQMCAVEARHFRMPEQKVIPDVDVLFVENAFDVKYYEDFYDRLGRPRPRLIASGTPMDSKAEPRPRPPAQDGEASRLVFCPGWGEGNTIQWILQWDLYEHCAFQAFCRAVAALRAAYPGRRFEAVVKTHPTLSRAIGVDTAAYYREIARPFGFEPVVDDGPIAPWLDGADLQVSSMPSSVQWEAFLRGVPSAAYLAPAWDTMLQGHPEGVDTLLTRWGAQRLLWDGLDWSVPFRELLEAKWSGAIEAIRRERLAGVPFVPPRAAAEAICGHILTHGPESRPAPLPPAPPIPTGKGKPMRILQIVHAFPPAHFGGTELYTLNLTRALIAQGHQVEVLYPIFEPSQPPFAFLEGEHEGVKVWRFNGVERHMPPEGEAMGPRYDAAFRAWIADRRYDIHHFQHVIFLSHNWPSIVRSLGRIAVLKIDDMHFTCVRTHLVMGDGSACTGPDNLDKCFKCSSGMDPGAPVRDVVNAYTLYAHRREVLRRAFRDFDFVHSASRFLVDHYRRFGFDHPNFRHLATGILPVEPRSRVPSPDGRLRIGYVGHVDTRKGIMVFLEAVERLQARGRGANLRFRIHGAVSDAAVARDADARIRRLRDVEYLGTFGPADRAAVFAGLDAMVVPSLGENYPFILREALAAGLPVISTAIAGIPEIVKPGVNGFLIPPKDAEALAEVFETLSADPGRLARMALPGMRLKRIDEEAREIADIFAALLAGRPLPAPEPDEAAAAPPAQPPGVLPAAAAPASATAAGDLEVLVLANGMQADWTGFLGHLRETAGRGLAITVLAAVDEAVPEPPAGTAAWRVVRAASAEEAGAAVRGAVLGPGGGAIVLTEPNLRLPQGWAGRLQARLEGGVGAVGPLSDRAPGGQRADGPREGDASEIGWLGNIVLCVSRRAAAGLDMAVADWEPRNLGLRLSRALKRRGHRLLVDPGVFAGDWSPAGAPEASRAASEGRP